MYVENGFEEDTTTMHWHGFHIAPEHDGGPHTPIAPKEIWKPKFKMLNSAGTYWYHPHLHEHTNLQVSKGALGMIIVRDNEEAALPLPRQYGIDDIPLILQTKPFNNAKQMPLNSHQDSVPLVNGTRLATFNAPAQVLRFRLLNASSDRTYLIGFSNNLPFYLIATDGGLVEKPVPLTRIRLSVGERAEILINLTGKEGQKIDLKSLASELPNGVIGAASVGMGMVQLEGYAGNALNGKDFNFLKINVLATNAKAITSIPTKLVTLSHPSVSDAKETRTLTFSPEGGAGVGMANMVNGPFQINKQSFEMETINYTIPLDNTEVWTLNNQTMVAHPFHIHDVEFWLLERDGKAVPASEQGWKDVVLVSPMSTVKFITTFSDFANPDVPYMYHCHILVHEDEGMMGQFIVKAKSTATEENNAINAVKITPNPINNDLNLKATFTNNNDVKVQIFNVLGAKMFEQNYANTVYLNTMIDCQNFTNGIYFVKINQGNSFKTLKFVKE